MTEQSQTYEQIRKRILYVDKDYSNEEGTLRTGHYNFCKIDEFLGENHDVVSHLNLDEEVLDILRRNFETGKRFDLLISHVPFDEPPCDVDITKLPRNEAYRLFYGRSLDLLKYIKSSYSVPIIAYTGADGYALTLINGIVDETIKKGDLEGDLIKIRIAIENIFNNKTDHT